MLLLLNNPPQARPPRLSNDHDDGWRSHSSSYWCLRGRGTSGEGAYSVFLVLHVIFRVLLLNNNNKIRE